MWVREGVSGQGPVSWCSGCCPGPLLGPPPQTGQPQGVPMLVLGSKAPGAQANWQGHNHRQARRRVCQRWCWERGCQEHRHSGTGTITDRPDTGCANAGAGKEGARSTGILARAQSKGRGACTPRGTFLTTVMVVRPTQKHTSMTLRQAHGTGTWRT
jgi:hypothetical protein